MNELILILDYGSPFKEIIARSIRDLHVYSEIRPGNISCDEVKRLNPVGIILAGDPNNPSLPKSLRCDPKLYTLGIPTIEMPDFQRPKRFEDRSDRLTHFLFLTCKVSCDYVLNTTYINVRIQRIRQQVGKEKVLLALSGGVDSSVCAGLLSKAIPGQLVCIFVDHGCMRLNEGDEIENVFSKRDLQFIRVNAQDRFLARLKGVTDPETKRKRIGEEFIRVFEEEAKKLETIPFLAQGTIYPDIVESGTEYGATVKSHHNVGGLPKNMSFTELVEPLSGFFKDEVRIIGKKLGLPNFLLYRQPFPGPGLAVRVLGEVTKEKLDILRSADAIFREEVEKLTVKPSQYFAILTDSLSVGIKEEKRTYSPVIALRAVKTADFMTCEYVPIRHKVLRHVAERITQEIPAVSRVVYDITSKPPATVEWE